MSDDPTGWLRDMPFAQHDAVPEPARARRRLPRWAWVAIGVGSLVVLVGGGTAVVVLAGHQATPPKPGAIAPRVPPSTPFAEPTSPPPGSPSPSVSASPSPSAPASSVAPAALPADRVYDGTGAKVVKLALTAGYHHIAAITHSGTSNFAVHTIGADGDTLDLIVNEVGAYKGVRPLDLEETPAALQIEADGAWRVEVRVTQKAPLWTGKATGTGAAVLRVDPATVTGLTTVTFTHTGTSNFAVLAHGESRDLLVNEIGGYSGETLLPRGTELVEIEADGAWTFERS